MTRLRFILAALGAAVTLALGGAAIGAYAAVASSPPVTSPTSGPGPYYSGPVHECISWTNESQGYFEEHSTALGNCAAGYRQVTLNELTPAFTLQLGSTAYACTAATSQAETAVTCAVPAPAPTGSSSSPG